MSSRFGKATEDLVRSGIGLLDFLVASIIVLIIVLVGIFWYMLS